MAKRDDQAPADLQQKIDELTADLQRVHADFVNFRRRNDEERAQVMDSAKASVITQLLPLFDTLGRALDHTPADLADHQWAKGIAQLTKQVEVTLKNLGVEKTDALHKPFDPTRHEAVSYEEEGEGEEVVIEVLQDGYQLHNQVIRPAVVKVGRQKQQNKEK